MVLHILQSALPQTWILQMIIYNGVMDSKNAYKNVFKFYKYIAMIKLWKIWSHTMYIKNKERVFKCILLYSMYCFPGNHIVFIRTRKQISYKKNDLTPCMNIIILKRIITWPDYRTFKVNLFCTKVFLIK